MTMKRTKGLTSLDLVMPVPSNYRTDAQLSNDTETIRMNTDNRWMTKDDITNNTNDISKIATSSRPKVEILRANSPTFKRLVSVRIKLDRHINSKSITISPSQLSIHETLNHEKQSTTDVRTASSSQKERRPKRNSGTAPLDKITYEKTWTRNGNVKQKCSLEIWLPKAGSDDDDGNTSRTTSPDHHINGHKSHSPQLITIQSRRPSTTKLPTTTTTANIETKSLDETSSKKSEPTLIPRVYHYEDYLTDQPEERPRSSKSGNTNKSDGNGSYKGIKHHRIHPHIRRLSPSTNNTEESVQSATPRLPMSSKNLLANLKQTYSGHETKGTTGSNNPSMIHELMKKYSMIKQNHQELTQPKLQLEKPYSDPKYNALTTKDYSLPSPPASDSTSYTSADQPLVSVRKLLRDTSPPQSATDSNTTNTKLLDRRSSHQKTSYSDIYPQARLFSLVNHLQYRQPANSLPVPLLPAVIGKKTDDQLRSFQRSKTIDVIFDASLDNSNKIPSRLPTRPDSPPHDIPSSSNLLQRTTNGNEQSPPRISKRSLLPPSHALRSEQQQQQTSQPLVQLVQYQNVQNSAQRYHHSAHKSPPTATDLSKNKVLVHLKYSNGGNTDRNCLIPE